MKPTLKKTTDRRVQRTFSTAKNIAMGLFACFGFGLFFTTVMAADEKPIGIVLVAGDIANCYVSRSRYSEVANLIGKQIENAENDFMPIRVIVLGDLAYKVGQKTYAECFKEFERTWGKYKSYFMPIPGNHDSRDDPTGNAKTMFEYFSDFYAGLPPEDVNENGSYVVKFPKESSNAWLFAAFNFYKNRSRGIAFLKNKLVGAKNDCIIGFAHPFFNSSGNHGSGLPNLTYQKLKPFFNVLHSSGAAAMLSAHDHHFEQFKRQGLVGEHSNTGVRQFLVGTGGAPLYSSEANPKHPLSEVFNRKTHGVLRLELFAKRYTWSFVPIDGQDTFVIPTNHDVCQPS